MSAVEAEVSGLDPEMAGIEAWTASRWPGSLFDDPSPTGAQAGAVLCTAAGDQMHINSLRWHSVPSREEQELLDRAEGSVLDIGCGPGRHVLALTRAGRSALGIDISAAAVAAARRRGAAAVRVSVFGPVPASGSWGTALLLDGNIGIGGDPLRLLSRVAAILRPGGHALVEVESSQVQSRRLRVRVEHGSHRSLWFPWARLAVSQVAAVANGSGFAVTEVWRAGDRWFADLERGMAHVEGGFGTIPAERAGKMAG